MEGKELFETKYEENSTRSDCRMRIQGMSDLFMHEVSFLHIWREYHIAPSSLVCMGCYCIIMVSCI